MADTAALETEPLLQAQEPLPVPKDALEGRRGDNVLRALGIVSILILLVTTWATVFSNDPYALSYFAWHPTMQTVAVTAYIYGITTLQPTATASSKSLGLGRHQVGMLLVGIPAAIIGIAAMYYNKASHGADHFTTYHGKFGLATAILLLLQTIAGAASVWWGGKAFGGGLKAKKVYKYHRVSGYITITLVLLSVHLAGYWSTWMVGHTNEPVRIIAYIVAPVVILISILGRVRLSKLKFF